MDMHNAAIIKIKTSLNTLVPMSTLPAEILADIFQIVVQTDRLRAVGTSPPYAWVAITHVCTHWREVALSTPTLWNYIVLPCRLQCVREMLARSQGVPLSIHHRAVTTRRRTEDLQSLQAALAAIHRVRLLRLFLPWETYRKVSSLLLAPAPLLTQMHVSTPNMLSCIGRAPPVLPLDQPTHPALATLDLSAYSVSWPQLATCSNLRHFSVHYAPFMRPTLHTVAEVLETLRGMPLLETLNLSNVLLSPLPQFSDPTRQPLTVNLPHLEHFTLCGEAAPSAGLLDNVHHPNTTRLTLHYSHIAETDLPIILPSIWSKLSGETTLESQSPIPFRSLAFGLDFKHALLIRGWTSAVPFSSPAADEEEIPVSFHFELPRWVLEHPQIWEGLPLHAVQSLCILSCPNDELTLPRVSRILRLTPSVKEACFTDWPVRSLVSLLGSIPGNDIATAIWDEPSAEFLIPEMQNLVLRDAVFEPCFGYPHSPRHTGCLQDLASVLHSRSLSPGVSSVQRVVLEKCAHIVASQVQTLKDTIPHVVWDGVVRVRDELTTDSDTDLDDGLEVIEGYED